MPAHTTPSQTKSKRVALVPPVRSKAMLLPLPQGLFDHLSIEQHLKLEALHRGAGDASYMGTMAEILFVGTARGMESRLVPQAGFPLELIQVGPLNQVSLLTKLRTLIGLPLSLIACSRIIASLRPDAVFGVGGYASGPAMGAAILASRESPFQ